MSQPSKNASEVLARILSAEGNEISLGRIMVAILNKFKGPDGFAEEWNRCFQQQAPSSPNRVRMLADVMKGISQCAQAPAGMEDLDEDDLKAIIRQTVVEPVSDTEDDLPADV